MCQAGKHAATAESRMLRPQGGDATPLNLKGLAGWNLEAALPL